MILVFVLRARFVKIKNHKEAIKSQFSVPVMYSHHKLTHEKEWLMLTTPTLILFELLMIQQVLESHI